MALPWHLPTRVLLPAALATLLLAAVVVPGSVGLAASAAWNGAPVALPGLQVVRQTHVHSCGPAALATLSSWLGAPRTEAELLQAATVGPTGITLSEFARLAHQIGLAGTWYQVQPKNLHLVPTPFVAHLEGAAAPGLGHLVAVAAVSHGYVTVADPATGAHVTPLRTFARRFTGRVYVLSEGAQW